MKFRAVLVLSVLVLYTSRSTKASCPSPCTCRTTSDGKKQVNCANKHLTNIPSSIEKDVNSIDLRGNRIQKISKETFAGYANLKVLYLDGNIISEIEALSFQDLKEVELLSLTNNRLSKIGKNAFAYIQGRNDCYSGMMSCNLDLRMNDIETIDSKAFAWITRLSVKIGGTKGTTTFKPYSFYGARRIPSLIIHSVARLHLHKHWLSETDGIGILQIKSCAMQSIVPFLFEGTSDICMMVFENNSFARISSYGFSGIQFAEAMCLDRLNLRAEVGSELRRHDETYALKRPEKDSEDVASIKPHVNKGCGGMVIFEKCVFPALSTDMFRDTNLLQIKLTGCQVTEMESNVFRGLDCLKNLYITDNTFEMGLAHGSFGSLNNLEGITFSRNELVTIHDHAFQGTQQVRKLAFILKPNRNFSLNPHALSGITEIENIQITGHRSDDNFLMIHSGAFDKMAVITNLTISNVHIPSLSEHVFYGVGKVKYLSFVDVHIDSFSSKAFGSLPVRTPISSFIITGDNTGINCDCDTLREVYNLNYMFEDHTIMCNSDTTDEGFISQRQTLSTDLMQLKNCKYDDRADSSLNSANRHQGSPVIFLSAIVHILLFLCSNYIVYVR